MVRHGRLRLRAGSTSSRISDQNYGQRSSYSSRLWSDHPGEMVQVYLNKGRTAGKHILSILTRFVPERRARS